MFTACVRGRPPFELPPSWGRARRLGRNTFAGWLPGPVRLPDVLGLRADEAVFGLLFEAVGRPSGDPADGEGRGEEVRGEAQAVQEEGRVELDVGLEVAARPVLREEAERRSAAAASTSARGSRTR